MPTMCELMRYEPLLFHLLLRLALVSKQIGGGSEEVTVNRGERTQQDWTPFTSTHVGLDARSMYEKLTMLNLQSGSNWSGPNNWYHDPTGVQTQHSSGEFISAH